MPPTAKAPLSPDELDFGKQMWYNTQADAALGPAFEKGRVTTADEIKVPWMDIDKIVTYWLTTAADDLVAAEHLLSSGDYSHALFFGHLYLEKVLKAHVVRQTKQHAPFGHNLRSLAKAGGLDLTPPQEAFLIRVTEYSAKTRYPDMDLQFKGQCTREFCERELKQIREFGVWTQAKLTS